MVLEHPSGAVGLSILGGGCKGVVVERLSADSFGFPRAPQSGPHSLGADFAFAFIRLCRPLCLAYLVDKPWVERGGESHSRRTDLGDVLYRANRWHRP